MRAASTNVARSMGYLSSPSVEERTYDGSNVVAVGFSSEMRSYHKGVSSRQAFDMARAAFALAGGKRRGSKTVLYAR